MARSNLPTPDSISGQQNIATPFTDLQPAARPYSVFTPETGFDIPDAPKTNGYMQLAGAMKDLMPVAIQGVKYVTDIDDERLVSEGAVAASKAAQDKNVKDLHSAMRAGYLPAGASPTFIKAWKENFLTLRSEQATDEMRAAYEANTELKTSQDPNAFNAWASQWRDSYMKSVLNGADGQGQYSALEIANSKFNERIQHSIFGLHKEHINAQVAEREKVGRQTADNLMTARLDEAFKGKDFFSVDYAAAAQRLTDVWQGPNGMVSKGGLNVSEINPAIANALITHAKMTRNPEVLKVAQFVKTPGGTLAGTSAWRAAEQQAREHIASEQYQEMMRQDAVDKLEAVGTREERIKYYSDMAAKGKGDLVRERLTRELSSDIYLREPKTQDDINARDARIRELYQVNPEAAGHVYSTVQQMETRQKTEHRTRIHDEMEGTIRQDILNNPLNPGHEKRIIDAFRNEVIDRDQMRSMLSFVQTYREKGAEPSALKDPAYTNLEKGVYGGVVKNLAAIGGMEAVTASKAAWDFRSEALDLIRQHPELATNGPALAAMMEKRQSPIAERYNKELTTLRKADEDKQAFGEYLIDLDKQMNNPSPNEQRKTDMQVEKAKEFDKRLKAHDADPGNNPDPRDAASQKTDATKPVEGAKKKQPTLSELRAALSPESISILGSAMKTAPEEQLRTLTRGIFSRHYTDPDALKTAVDEFIKANRKKKK
jgi:hypothetical protein